MRIRRQMVRLFAAALGLAGQIAAAAVVSNNFDGPQVSWQLLDGRPDGRLLSHGCVSDQARQGTGSERLVYVVPGGESLHFACQVGRLPVVDEFEAAVWLRSNRPGAVLAARVVLPRSKAPHSDAARTLLVTGDALESVDRWQQLRIQNLPRLLAAQVRVLRATQRAKIDSHEAYVDAIVLVAPGGPDNATLWTDALEVDGVLLTATTEAQRTVAPAVFSAPNWPHTSTPGTSGAMPSAAATVHFRGKTLIVAGRPFFSRGIDWNGEPFAFLAARGFNTIWLEEPPTVEQLTQATQANVWLVCRPPSPEQLAVRDFENAPTRVLAWQLTSPSGAHQLDYHRRWADQLRDMAGDSARPVLISPRGDWLPVSQLADVLVADHPAASVLSTSECAEWLTQLPLLARAGTPFWASVPTQPRVATHKQAAMLTAGLDRTPTMLPDRQIEALLAAVLSSGCRGIRYESSTPLDASDLVTRRRAALLEQWNDRVELIEPWLATGKRGVDVAATVGSIRGVVWTVERARLFLPTQSLSMAESQESPLQKSVLLIPGIPLSNEAFALSPASFQTLASQRVAGGLRVELPRDFDGYVLMTEDPSVIAKYRQRVARGARRTAQVQYGLAAGESRALAEAARQLQNWGFNTKQLDLAIGSADADAKAAGAALTAGNFALAYKQAARASRTLESAIDEARIALPQGPTFDSVPCFERPVPLVARAAFDRSFAALRAGENQLSGGDFEDLDLLRQVGWQHVEDPLPGIQTTVALSGVAPRDGRYCLRLAAAADSAGEAPQIVARAPAWITTPPFRALAGEFLEISGWVRVTEPIRGSIEGLEIADSIGGHELALRIRHTEGWQPFRLVRATKDTTEVTLTFALHGMGSVEVDSVMVRSLTAPQVKRLPSPAAEPGPAFPDSVRRPVYPPVMPQ